MSQDNWAHDLDTVAQIFCVHFKDIMPFHLAISSIPF
jgi:hypothetical protein